MVQMLKWLYIPSHGLACHLILLLTTDKGSDYLNAKWGGVCTHTPRGESLVTATSSQALPVSRRLPTKSVHTTRDAARISEGPDRVSRSDSKPVIEGYARHQGCRQCETVKICPRIATQGQTQGKERDFCYARKVQGFRATPGSAYNGAP